MRIEYLNVETISAISYCSKDFKYIPTQEIPNAPCWGLTSSREYSVHLATWLARGIHSTSHTPWQFYWIWKLDIAPKVQIFLWQILHNGLPLMSNL